MDPQTAPNKGIPDLAAAYVQAWAEITTVEKNAVNPHFNSGYADLAAVQAAIHGPFAKHGLALLMAPDAMEGEKVSITWVLIHRSGQSIHGRAQLPIGPKATAQAAGSAITYLRRYLAAAIAGLAQVDDDGNAASNGNRKGGFDRASLLASIDGALTPLALEKLRTNIAELGDQSVADAYRARKVKLRADAGLIQ